MSAWLPVPPSRLRRRSLITPDWSLAKAALFRFFNRQGVISRVMVVHGGVRGIPAVRSQPGGSHSVLGTDLSKGRGEDDGSVGSERTGGSQMFSSAFRILGAC